MCFHNCEPKDPTITRNLFAAVVIILGGGFNFVSGQSVEDVETNRNDKASLSSSDSIPEMTSKKKGSDVRVEFPDDSPGIVIIETAGKRYRIDPKTKSVTVIGSISENTSASTSSDTKDRLNADAQSLSQSQDIEEELGDYDFEPGDEPFDYRIVNVPTPKSVPKGTWNLSFSHRFTQPIHPISRSAETLLGFDSFSVSSFAVTYGITDKLYVSVGRSPICRRRLCRTIEIGAGYHLLDQTKESPVGLTFYGSVEGDRNFSEDYTFNLQTMVSRRAGKRVYLFFSPAVHINANGNRRFDPRPDDFFPPAPVANTFRMPAHAASFGFGTTVMITPDLLGLFEFTPRVGFKLGRVIPLFDSSFNITGFENKSFPSLGFGIQKNIGNHSFALTFTNTQTTTTSRYNSSNLVLPPKRIVIGFNLFRRF